MTLHVRRKHLQKAYEQNSILYFSYLQSIAHREMTELERVKANRLYQPVWDVYKKLKEVERELLKINVN